MLRRLTPWLVPLGLAIATILLWQTRFKAVPHPLNGDAGFEAGFDGWNKGGGKNGIRKEDGATVARFAKPAGNGEFNSATRWLGSLEGLRFLHVEVEAKWDDVIGGSANWARPRLVLITKNHKGRTMFTWDHGAYLANGTRDWHKEEAVFELTPIMSEIGLAFQMFGSQGQMEVRKFRITALKIRPWVPAATALLLAGWALWLAMRLRGRKQPVAWWRVLPAAIAVLAASWYLIFPGPRMQYRPMIGTLMIGAAESPTAIAGTPAKPPPPSATPATKPTQTAATPKAKTKTGSQTTQPRIRVIPPQGGTQPPALPTPKSSTAPSPRAPVAKPPPPPPERRSRSLITDAIRNLDLKLDLIHITAFFGLSLVVFLLVGRLHPWPLLCVISLLSEVVPIWHDGWVDAADMLDLAANLGGVALGAGAFVLIHRLLRKLPRFRRSSGSVIT